MNKQQLYELLRLDPRKVADPVEFWALYATSFYERLLAKINDPKEVEQVYQRMKRNPKLNRKAIEALTFFYKLRMDELENPDFWDMQSGKIKENMKTKLVAESLNEFGPFPFKSGKRKKSVRSLVQEIGELDLKILMSGNTQAQNEWDIISNEYLYSGGEGGEEERYWDDLQDAELEQAIQDATEIVGEYQLKESLQLNESVSRYCDIYKTDDGKWYMDLANEEYGEYDDCTTYGPFNSSEAANTYLHDNHSNPGGGWEDDSGDRPVPTESPNGSSIVRPGGGGRSMGYGGRFTGVRW